MRSSDGSESKPAEWLWLAPALALYAALRWAWLHFAFDSIALAMYELYPMGTIPKVLPEGHSLPLRDYYDNAAGQLLTGLLAIPFYEMFGQSYLALKLVPATLGALALIVIFAFARRFFGIRAAIVASLVFALTPTTSVKYSLVASGNHYENVFFSVVALAAFFFAHRNGARPLAVFFAALCAGFALFVFLGALILVGLLALTHLGLRGWRRTALDLRVLVPGFALGLVPLLVLNLGHDSRGATFLDKRFGIEEAERAEGLATRFSSFYAEHLPHAGVFPDLAGVPGRLGELALLGAFAIAWLVAAGFAWRGARELVRGALSANGLGSLDALSWARIALVPLVAYLPLCSLAYATSNLVIGGHGAPGGPMAMAGYRYFLFHFATVALLVGVLFTVGLHGTRTRLWKLGASVVAAAAVATSIFHFGEVDLGRRGQDVGARYDGFHYPYYARGLLGRRNRHTQAEAIELAARVPDEHRPQVYFGVGFYRGIEQHERFGENVSRYELASVLEGWPDRYRRDVARGFGCSLRPRQGDLENGKGEQVEQRALAWLESGEAHATDFVEGLCTPWDYWLISRTRGFLDENVRMTVFAAPRLQPALARGAGHLIGRLLARGIDSDAVEIQRTVRQLSAAHFDELCVGVGFGLAEGRDREVSRAWLTLFDRAHWAAIDRGIAAGLDHVYGGHAERAGLAATRATLRSSPAPTGEQ